MKKVIVLLTAIILILSGCSCATIDGAGKEMQDTIANVADADNKYVLMVKGGYQADNPDVTYDQAFSAFFSTPRWKYFESEDGQDVVEFTGDCTYQDVPVKARLQFVVDEEAGTFEATALAFNEVPQSNLIMLALITKAFEEVGNGASPAPESASSESSVTSDEASNGATDLTFNETSLTDWMEGPPDIAYDIFGWPDYGTVIDNTLLSGGVYFGYDEGVTFVVNSDTEMIGWITGAPEAVIANGSTLDRSHDEIIALLGAPDSEGEAYDEMDGINYYYMQYTIKGYGVQIEFSDKNSKANSFLIAPLSE